MNQQQISLERSKRKKLNDLKNISSAALFSNTVCLVNREREITLEIVRHFREIERRRLFAERGYASLFEMAVHEFKYSEAAAMRRISAMRLLKELPELEGVVEKGGLSLSNASKLHSFFKAEAKAKKAYSLPEKLELAQKMTGLSARQCEKKLAAISPQAVRYETTKAVTGTTTEIKIVLDDVVLKKLEKIKGLIAHVRPDASYAEIIEYMVDLTLEKIDPERKKNRTRENSASVAATKTQVNPASGVAIKAQTAPVAGVTSDVGVKPSPRYIPAAIKQIIFSRDQGQCTYIDSKTRRRCTSKYMLEYDHIKPFALGGLTEIENLRLFCRTHNQLSATRNYGQHKVSRHILSLK